METSQTNAPTLQSIPIAALFESPHNTRKHFDAVKLAELTESVRTHGVITPLLARPNGKRFEIAAGHRRFRAAQAAALAEVPVLVREMDEAEFQELLAIENLQRADLHALEEGQGFLRLLKLPNYNVEKVAAKIGKSAAYVYDRLKLTELIEPLQQDFFKERFTVGHAILLARLSPAEQERAREHGLYTGERTLFDPRQDDDATSNSSKPMSVRELAAWIDENVRFDAKAADPMLFPETVAVVTTAQEEEEKIVPITLEYFIRPEAREGRTFGPKSWKRADGHQDSKTCERSVTGVIVVGAGRGEAFKVCVNKDKCAVHWGAERRAKAKRAKQAANSPLDDWQARRAAEQAREQAKRKRWSDAVPTILKAVAEKIRKSSTKTSGVLGRLILDELSPRHADAAFRREAAGYATQGPMPDDLIRHAAFLILHSMAREWSAPESFPKVAAILGVDVKKILAEQDKAAKQAEKAAAVDTEAKPKKSPKKKVAAKAAAAKRRPSALATAAASG